MFVMLTTVQSQVTHPMARCVPSRERVDAAYGQGIALAAFPRTGHRAPQRLVAHSSDPDT